MSEKKIQQFNIEIDGQPYVADFGETIMQVADRHGVYIPRFCYHKKLSIAANCRMCLVEVEGARKPSASCATPVTNGMKVFTKSAATISYQKKIMEFLLINHPLDCPICDQGGECELQDIVMGYGSHVSQYSETKRVFGNPDLGPLIATDMTRCIQCTRCVRFGEEIGGDKELGVMGRGDHSQISSFVEKSIDSELSGNMIDLCPVGALTSKPFKFQARAWELQQYETISAADCVGANIYAHIRRGKIMRIVPRENEVINETWIADKDRFAYTGISSKNRIDNPMLKKDDGTWVNVSWQEALNALKVIIEQTKKTYNSDVISALASDSATTESLYLIQKFMRAIGSNNIDTRLKQGSHISQLHTGIGFNCHFSDIENADVILLIGSYLRKEIPLINHRVKKAEKKGAKIFAINSQEYDFNFKIETFVTEADKIVHTLTELVSVISTNLRKSIRSKWVKINFDNLGNNPYMARLALTLISAKNPAVILGFDTILNKKFDRIYALFMELKELITIIGGVLSFGANARGALFAGASSDYLPGGIINNLQQGMSLPCILESEKTKLLLSFGIEVEIDCTLKSHKVLNNLTKIDNVIVFSSYITEKMYDYANIILPIATHFEEDGSFINISGITQRFKALTSPHENSKPLWKVMRVLANLLSLDNFNYQTIDDIYEEYHLIKKVKPEIDFDSLFNDKDISTDKEKLEDSYTILPSLSMYCTNGMLRNAIPLQLTRDVLRAHTVRVSKKFAKQHSLKKSGMFWVQFNNVQKEYEVNIFIDEKLADNTMFVPFQIMPTCDKIWQNATFSTTKNTR